MFHFRGLCLLFFLSCFFISPAQRPGDTHDTSVYREYGKQIVSLMQARGMPGPEIDELLKIYQRNNITSDKDFAILLGKLYPSGRGIGIIFYFFNHDTLRRVFFEPGIVKEITNISVTKEKLLELSVDFNHVLGLYNLSDKRMPVKRGVIITTPPKPAGLTYDGLIKNATQLLLPKAFNASYKHLLIIPALNIGTLPFQLLAPYGDGSLLIDRCSFTIAPGIIDLIGLRVKTLKTATRWGGNISVPFDENEELMNFDSSLFMAKHPLFISDPAYPVNTPFIFPDLPGAKKEVMGAMKYTGPPILLEGEKARKDSVFKHLGDADLVYFATHGIADAEKPMEKSFVVLSGNNPFLTAKNIMDCRKNYRSFPEMVILSACQTGLGKAMEAGVAGLARSFLLAGANHVIMSLWNVDDEATAYLMVRFLYHLLQPSRFMPAEPLRQALLDTRKKFPLPSRWASFSLFGIDY